MHTMLELVRSSFASVCAVHQLAWHITTSADRDWHKTPISWLQTCICAVGFAVCCHTYWLLCSIQGQGEAWFESPLSCKLCGCGCRCGCGWVWGRTSPWPCMH